ncbi:hypothetical protein Y032_0139g2141 [Ancylostoma ceylanicum]|uniref:Peptidase M13 C-terminal domain-containing protein n=1 Tax=Ancylostoma ceylanicum TaxID=53326 RepID=A0A016T4P1_9BILA|nr:hypothetical protein Y032_0139g2141 [Ancylostoma ceylanicum]
MKNSRGIHCHSLPDQLAGPSLHRSHLYSIFRQIGYENDGMNCRVNNVFANMPEFAEAFHCAPGTRMNPSTRCPLY